MKRRLHRLGGSRPKTTVGVDEEGTLAQLKALRRTLVDPKIDEHGGRIAKTAGDGLLAQFWSVVDPSPAVYGMTAGETFGFTACIGH